MSNFAYPEWQLPPGYYDPPPPLDPETRRDLDTQVEALNGFIEARQKVLHLEPDAYYRKRGREAVEGASAITDRLNGLKAEIIANAGTDYERRALEERTSALIGLDQDDIRRHVRSQLKEWQRQAMTRRIELMRKQAGFNWKDSAALQTYADAAESAARDHGWADGLAPDSDEVRGRVQAARSGVLRSAVEAALNGNHLADAIALYEQISPHLAADDIQAVGPQIDYARELETGHGYVAPFIKALPDRPDEIDTAHRAALERNAVDWPDSPSQHATNRYLIDRAFGEHRHAVAKRRADLEKQIAEWVDQRQPGDSPWPPRRLWMQLDPDQRRDFYLRVKATPSTAPTSREGSPDPTPDLLQKSREVAQVDDPASGGRGIPPTVEPPSNDLGLEKEFEQWQGRIVRLPDGSPVSDPHSPTGYLMSPFADLGDVAMAGRRAGSELRHLLGISETAAVTYLYNALKQHLGQGGTFDYQRKKYKFGRDGFTQLRLFRNVANFNVGLFCQQAGLGREATLRLAGGYARLKSKNAGLDQPYWLDPQTRYFIELGYTSSAIFSDRLW